MHALIGFFILLSTLSFADPVALTKERVPIIKNYIAALKAKGMQPKLVIGATSTDFGLEAGEEWILANNDIQDKDNQRNMYLDFLHEGSMEVIANEFPNTFQTISFDGDVLGFMEWSTWEPKPGHKAFGKDSVLAIKKILAPLGTFQLPRNIQVHGRDDVAISTLEEYLVENRNAIDSDNFVYEALKVNEGLDSHSGLTLTPQERLRRESIKKSIVDYVIENNVKRILTEVFGEHNVAIHINVPLEIRPGLVLPHLFVATKR